MPAFNTELLERLGPMFAAGGSQAREGFPAAQKLMEAAGGGGAATGGGRVAQATAWAGKGANLAWILPMIAGWFLNSKISQYGKIEAQGQETEALNQKSENTTPESMYYKAMMPAAQQEGQMAQMMLMQQLMGGQQGPRLAKGEELIGGR